MKKYDVIILAGGEGTRVKKFTKKIPKCLIKFNGKPFLYLKKNKIKNVIISSCYLSNKINNYVKNNINFIKVKIINDGKPLGTGGAIVNSLKYLNNNFFVVYGDSFLNFNLNKLKNKSNIATMAIFRNNNKYDRSNIALIKSNKILYFKKKTKKKLNYIDYGASYLSKKIFKNEKRGTKFDLSEFFERISKLGMLKRCLINKRFYEIGSYNGIDEFNSFIKKDEFYK